MNDLRVVAVNTTQFFRLRETAAGIYEGIGGFEYELLKVLSKAMKFNFQLLKQRDNAWGHPKEDGQWTGMVGTLQRNEADMVVQYMGMTYQRFQVVDFASPHAIDRATFVAKPAEEVSKDFVYFYPFQYSVWIAVAVSLIICSLFFAMILYSMQKDSRASTYFCNVLTVFEVLTGNRAFESVCKNFSLKLFFGFNGLAMRLLTLCFCAIFLSFLMAPIMGTQIKTFKELAKISKNGQARVTAVKGTFLATFLMDENDPLTKYLGKYVRKHPESFLSHKSSDGIASILDGFYLLEAVNLQKLRSCEILGRNDNLFYSEDSLQVTPVGIAFRKQFCCVEQFSKMILKLHQSGVILKIFNDHLYRLRLTSRQSSEKSQDTERTLFIWDLRGAFFISAAGFTLAILMLVTEIIWWKFWPSA